MFVSHLKNEDTQMIKKTSAEMETIARAAAPGCGAVIESNGNVGLGHNWKIRFIPDLDPASDKDARLTIIRALANYNLV
jgi:hypothetical protein